MHGNCKYLLNENTFDIIDTEEKAYFLGFLYADGYNKCGEYICLSINEDDGYILENLKNLLGSNQPIKHINVNNGSNQKRLTIYNKYLSMKLSELGCVQAKSLILKFPLFLDENLYKSFILGYYDGDGGISINKNEYSKASVSITGTFEMLEKINNISNDKLGIKFYFNQRYPERNNNNYTISICGNVKVVKFLDWLYSSSSSFLIRKKKKYDFIKSLLAERVRLKYELEQKVIEDYLKFKNMENVAKLNNISPKTVSTILKRNNIVKFKFLRMDVIELFNNGKTRKQIAEILDMDYHSVKKSILDYKRKYDE